MATVPTPRTWTVGELLTAAKLNADLRDGLNLLLGPPLAVLRRSGDVTITFATQTPYNWNVEQIDRDNGHDNTTNPSRYVVQTAGWYRLSTVIDWYNISSTDFFEVGFRLNGTIVDLRDHGNMSASGTMRLSNMMFLSVSQYVEVWVYCNTANHNTAGAGCGFSVEWAAKA